MSYSLDTDAFINALRRLNPVVLDHEGGVPLSPNHLLLLRAKDHSIGVFNHRDNYMRRSWRQVHYLADQFWLRWRKVARRSAELCCRPLGPS